MAETLGTLTDKLMVVNMKIWHMEDQCRREDVELGFIGECKGSIDILNQQRNDLMQEIDLFLHDCLVNGKVPKPYNAMKMYNNKDYKNA